MSSFIASTEVYKKSAHDEKSDPHDEPAQREPPVVRLATEHLADDQGAENKVPRIHKLVAQVAADRLPRVPWGFLLVHALPDPFPQSAHEPRPAIVSRAGQGQERGCRTTKHMSLGS